MSKWVKREGKKVSDQDFGLQQALLTVLFQTPIDQREPPALSDN